MGDGIDALPEEARALGLTVCRMIADLDLVVALARENGAPALISLIRQHYAEARAHGLSMQGCFMLLKYYEILLND